MITLSHEQFNRLLQAAKQSNQRPGSFISCTARFNGERSPTKVEGFIATVLAFKEVEKVSDSDAISGMPIILEGNAAEWWQGVKTKAETFSDVVRMLREAFSPPKPAWRIYSEIVKSKQQKKEPIDTFIRRKRALFSQLANVPAEVDQIDIVFGLIDFQIRDRISRERVKNFDELLREAREAEWSLQELRNHAVDVDPQRSGGPSIKTKKKKNAAKITHATVLSQLQPSKSNLSCYGCNSPGVTRANCSKCMKKTVVANPSPIYFNTINVTVGRDIPLADIQLFGITGQAYFDTGARTSVASANMKRVMDSKGCVFKSITCEISLADGVRSSQKCLSTLCKVTIGGRCLDTKFIVLPNADNNRALLGADFMEEAGIVMNMGQRYWYFEDEPSKHFEFVDSLPLELNITESLKVRNFNNKRKPEDVAKREVDSPKVYVSESAYYGPEVTSAYSTDSIKEL